MPPYPESEYCTFLDEMGRRCRALKMPTREVCIAHWRRDGEFSEDEAAVAEVLAQSGALLTPEGIHRAIAALFRAVLQGKIPPRKASQLSYMAHLMLCSLPRARRNRVEAPAVPEFAPASAAPPAGAGKANGSGSGGAGNTEPRPEPGAAQ
jgi:hypothetical protein